MKYRLASLGLAVWVFGAAYNDALAQNAPPTAAAPASEDSLAEITVTAAKVESTEQRTPISMSVLTAETLQRNNVATLSDLAQIAPSVEFSQNDESEIITIRGVSSRDTTEIGDPDVSVDIDGLYFQRAIGLGDSIFDLERVEVLRGPQGTLYGRNAVGGAINFITAKPKNEFEASASVVYGNYNAVQTEGMVNMPVSDSVQIRASFFTRSHSGYANNAPAQDGDDADSKAARLHVALEPFDDLKILLTGQFVHLGGVGTSINGTPLVYEPDGSVDHNFPAALSSGRTFPHNLPSGYLDSLATSFQVHIDYSLPWADLLYSGGYRHLNYHNLFNLDGVSNVYDGFQQNEHPITLNHEFRIASKPDSWFQWQAGVFYFDESNQLLTFFQDTKPNPPQNLFTFNYPSIDAKSKAGFAQGSIPLMDNLRLELGARYSKDDKERTGYLNYGSGIADESAASSSSKTTYHAALNWQATPSNLIYLKYDTGYKAGGFTDAAPYSPETLSAVEIGAKNRWLDNRLQLNAAAFYYDYKDQQISQFVGNQTIIRNAGKSRIDGVEFDSAALLTKDDKIDAYLGFLDAKFTEFDVAGATGNISLAGNAPPQAPKVTLNVGYQHTVHFAPGSLTGRVQTHYESTSYNTFFNYADDRQGGYSRTDAFLTWTPADAKWEVQAYGRNLENKRIIVSASEQPLFGTYVYQFGDPRTYGVRFSTKW
jgi:iron complex outermembrane receptor protein